MKSFLSLFLLLSAWSLKAQSATTQLAKTDTLQTSKTDTSQISKTDSVVYFKPEIEAMYPGGINAWAQFLNKNLKYPDKAQKNDVQGKVVTQFVVDSTGIAHDVVAISGPEELRAETIRMIKKVKVWEPAIQNGKKVNSVKTQPFIFKIEN